MISPSPISTELIWCAPFFVAFCVGVAKHFSSNHKPINCQWLLCNVLNKVVSLKVLSAMCHLEIKAMEHSEVVIVQEHVNERKFAVGYATQCFQEKLHPKFRVNNVIRVTPLPLWLRVLLTVSIRIWKVTNISFPPLPARLAVSFRLSSYHGKYCKAVLTLSSIPVTMGFVDRQLHLSLIPNV